MQEASVKETKNGNVDDKYISPRRLKAALESFAPTSDGNTSGDTIHLGKSGTQNFTAGNVSTITYQNVVSNTNPDLFTWDAANNRVFINKATKALVVAATIRYNAVHPTISIVYVRKNGSNVTTRQTYNDVGNDITCVVYNLVPGDYVDLAAYFADTNAGMMGANNYWDKVTITAVADIGTLKGDKGEKGDTGDIPDLSDVNNFPTSVSIPNGTYSSGTLADLQTLYSGNYVVNEVSATPGFVVEFTFSSVSLFNKLRTNFRYAGVGYTHIVLLQIYNYNTSSWETLTDFQTMDTLKFIELPLPNTVNYISGGQSKIRFNHSGMGNNTHSLSIDYLNLVNTYAGTKGDTGPQGPQGIQGPAGNDGRVYQVHAGANITVDNTDPANPIISSAASPLSAYPVGAIFQSTVATNPATLFGGTWVALTDRFLIGAGGSYANGATGGASTHTLAIGEIPWHNHTGSWIDAGGVHNHNIAYGGVESTQYIRLNSQSGGNAYSLTWASGKLNISEVFATNAGSHTHGLGIVGQGGSGAHNNMPPYRAVHQWYRSA